ncbi:MAG: nucleotidyltransferase domain-containing protein [Deltaproteobacteria bacterium]|nr:nucleotidyltransferase domain-containing protein [Deltaproteobacteria bacterium]MBW2154408.1 nucleotidyltransferase domain-containing protein [Deltaproteobacteria bacterium]
MPISSLKMAEYKITAKKRWLEEQKKLSLDYDRALLISKQAAFLLKKHYGVKRVVLFGSLAHKERFHQGSDVDLAVLGLAEKKYFRAVARLLNLSHSPKIDLVRIEDVSDSLKKHIEQEGLEL